MIFWIFVILTLLGIGIIVAVEIICKKYDSKEENNTKFVSFVWKEEEGIKCICVSTVFVSVVITLFMLALIVCTQIFADGDRVKMEQRYKVLVYKSQTESVRDEFGIINKEYIDEIQEWNEDLAKHQSYSHNIWISIFYPKRKYDGLEFIDLENIKMRD